MKTITELWTLITNSPNYILFVILLTEIAVFASGFIGYWTAKAIEAIIQYFHKPW